MAWPERKKNESNGSDRPTTTTHNYDKRPVHAERAFALRTERAILSEETERLSRANSGDESDASRDDGGEEQVVFLPHKLALDDLHRQEHNRATKGDGSVNPPGLSQLTHNETSL